MTARKALMKRYALYLTLSLTALLNGCAAKPYVDRTVPSTCSTVAVEVCSRSFLGMPWDPRESSHVLCQAGDCECHRKLEAASWTSTDRVDGFTVGRPLRPCYEVEQ